MTHRAVPLFALCLAFSCAKAPPPPASVDAAADDRAAELAARAEQGSEASSPATPSMLAKLPEGAFLLGAKQTMSRPEKLPELMGSYFDAHVLLSVGMGEAGPVIAVDSADGEGVPMSCGITTLVPLSSMGADGAFSLEVDELPFVGEDGLPFSLEGARIAGRIRAEGLTLDEVTGTIDSADFVELLGSEEPGALCDMVGGNIPCGACPDGGETCWEVALNPELTAAPVFEQRSADTVCSDPVCGDRPWCSGD